MEILKDIMEIIKIVIPSIVVFVTAFYIMKKFFENEDKKRQVESKMQNHNLITPIRLQAYERMILFLERISPESLVMRVHKQGMNGRKLQQELLQNIRTEFEHNIAQQIYVSNSGWELVKRAKEETIKIVNIASSKINDSSSSIDLSKAIFDIVSGLEKIPTQIAIEYLKKEIRQSF
jgi:hypothetical protein